MEEALHKCSVTIDEINSSDGDTSKIREKTETLSKTGKTAEHPDISVLAGQSLVWVC